MTSSRKTVRWAIAAVAAIVAVPVLAYAFARVVNWRDEPPSAESLELAATPVPPEIPDADNAYVYLLGFATSLAEDPAEAGARRADQLRALATGAPVPAEPATDRGSAFDLQHIPPALEAVLGQCSNADAACVSALDASAGSLLGQLQQQRPLIERYLALLRFKSWQEVPNVDTSGPPPPYLEARYARQLFLLDAWMLAVAGDANEVRARLEADLTFWRLVLTDADSLLAKALAANFASNNFEWGNLLLRRLPTERRADGVPEGWRKAQTATERSMRRALTGEWRLFAASLMQLKANGFAGSSPGRQPSLGERFNDWLWLPMLQPQASANRYAAMFVKLDALLSVPYAELPAALTRAPETDAADTGIVGVTYNLIGDQLALPDPATLAYTGARVANFEGVRRAALMTADLRALTIPADLAGAMIPLAAVRDPYTGGPFGWTPKPAAVTFTGLPRDAGYTFLY